MGLTLTRCAYCTEPTVRDSRLCEAHYVDAMDRAHAEFWVQPKGFRTIEQDRADIANMERKERTKARLAAERDAPTPPEVVPKPDKQREYNERRKRQTDEGVAALVAFLRSATAPIPRHRLRAEGFTHSVINNARARGLLASSSRGYALAEAAEVAA